MNFRFAHIFFMFYVFISLCEILAFSQVTTVNYFVYNQKKYQLYPAKLDECPDIPSPFTTENGIEVVICFTKDKKYTIIPVTVENEKLWYYENNGPGKGKQLDVDTIDFPILAKTGLHSEIELDQTKTITGRSIAEITDKGRPESSSGAGFMAHDEDIISVLKGDNQLVGKIGLSHPQIAKPLFHIWNIVLEGAEKGRWTSEAVKIEYILYNMRKIFLKWGGRGWQESIFNDGILGAQHLEMWRELDKNEKAFLSAKYSDLSEEKRNKMIQKLSYIHTGEMVPYYIMRYGFYEGHTDYRADPISIAMIFGLRSIEEIEKAFKGGLYNALTGHFTKTKFQGENKNEK